MIKRFTIVFSNEYYATDEDDTFDKQMEDINDQVGERSNWKITAHEDAPMCESCNVRQITNNAEEICAKCAGDEE